MEIPFIQEKGRLKSFVNNTPLFRKLKFRFFQITILREWYIRKEIKRIQRKSVNCDMILDAGSGPGQWSYYLARKFPKSIVVSIDKDLRSVYEHKFFISKIGLNNNYVYQASLEEVGFRTQFDIILCINVLEHIQDDVVVLRNFHTYLKEGGRLLVYVPIEPVRYIPLFKRIAEKKFSQAVTGHVRDYSLQEIYNKITDSNFKIEKVIITNGKPGAIAYELFHLFRDTRYFFLYAPFYLLFIHPFVMMLMYADFKRCNKEGNGALIIAEKSAWTGKEPDIL